MVVAGDEDAAGGLHVDAVQRARRVAGVAVEDADLVRRGLVPGQASEGRAARVSGGEQAVIGVLVPPDDVDDCRLKAGTVVATRTCTGPDVGLSCLTPREGQRGGVATPSDRPAAGAAESRDLVHHALE